MTEAVETPTIEAVCERIMSAFGNDDREVLLNANDLFSAAGTSRQEFVKALEVLTEQTNELTELERDVDYDEETGSESVLYLRPASRRQAPEPAVS